MTADMNTRLNLTQDRLPLEREARVREKDERLSAPQPLSDYRDVPAWVLLGDPGAGKSDVFNSLSLSEGGTCVSARDFVELDLPSDWQEPLFIDGLDEITSGQAMGSTPLGQIRQKLQRLGTPKFRLSCREADWRGNVDAEALKQLVGGDSFAELHLAPLSHAQSVALIAHWQPCTEAQAEAFKQEAEKRDLGGLLDNPQTLRMLVKAHAANGGDWPASKTQTYEMACEQLVREHNDEHLANSRDSTPSDDQTLLAAGYLCAVMLLSGSGAIALQRRSQSGVGVVTLPELKSADSAPDLPACRAALHTRLFRGNGTGDFWPVHRTVAEYLGAQYLASRIQAGLPASRVQALMLGEDAGIVPELRGLHAWLAATAPEELRRELIERDPLGVVLNGDVRAFHHTDKLAVLNALQHEATQAPSFRRGSWISYPFGALATSDMEDAFKVLLQPPERSPAHQAVLECLLDALMHGQPMPTLIPILEQVARDKTYRSHLRTAAVRILIAYASVSENWTTVATLLADVHANVVEDSEDELLGTLLGALYPNHISPTEVWRYFRSPKTVHFLGAYWMFWHELPKRQTTPIEVTTSLDALVAANYQLKDEYDQYGEAELVGGLLVKGISQHGEEIDVARLYRWLGLGLGEYFNNHLRPEHATVIKQWLEDHPTSYKTLFEYGLTVQDQEHINSGQGWWCINAIFHGAAEPADAKCWYMSLAEKTVNDDWRHQLIFNAIRVVEQADGERAGTALLNSWTALYPADIQWVNQVLEYRRAPPDSDPRNQAERIEVKEKLAQQQRDRMAFFEKHLPGFAPGPAHLGALVEVAKVYLNITPNSKEQDPQARLLELLNHNQDWLRLALHGLRQSLFRDDLPTAEDVIKLQLESCPHYLVLPCLAAMALRYSEDAGTAFDLPISILKTVTAFRLTTPLGNTPGWFNQLLAQQPSVLSSVMQHMISQQISAKKEHIESLYALARDAKYASVARQIAPHLIADFPVKASEKLLKNLRMLIVSALTNLDRETQLTLIANKLGAKGMDVAQQAYWLTAGFLLAPELYLDRAQQFAAKTQVRSSHVFSLIHEWRSRSDVPVDLPIATQIFLIGLLGPKSNPGQTQSGVYSVTPDLEMGDYVAGLISSLASNPDDAATQALTNLQQRHDMKHWHDSLKRALYDQRITRRKARFKPSPVGKVCDTLANLKPANAADLWALTVYHLTQLVHAIQHSNTDQYDHYWSGDKPQSEEICRNLLLTHLQLTLAPLGISAEPERRHPDKKRSDIEVASGLLHIPIEVKGEWNGDIWKGIPNQLVAKYGREAASDSYGIYLVFWFAYDLKAASTDGGTKPKTPQELQQRLTATIPEPLKHKIAVLVVDCSKPEKV